MKDALNTTLIAIFILLSLYGCACNEYRRHASTAQHGGDGISTVRERIIESATAMLGTPYRYGGSSPQQGFDCSGLVLYSHNRAGIKVPRTAAQQLRYSRKIRPDQLQPGDLLFFRIESKPSHVSIYLGDGMFIHAPSSGGRVRTESLDNPFWNRRLVETGSFIL